MNSNPAGSLSDLQLAECVTHRQVDAFNEIYRRHSPSVAKVALMVLGSSMACEDIVAEVFVAFWLKPSSFDATRGSLLGFLRMKARGRSIDFVRTDVARRRRESIDSRASRHGGRQPDEDILTIEAAEKLHEALATLDHREREPIELAFFAGMTYRQVAEHLRMPEGTIKSRIRSGLHNARAIFDSELLAGARV